MSPESSSRGEILFHHPYPLVAEPKAGSEIRPRRMVDAFREIGYEVVEIAGYSGERIPRMRAVAEQIAKGRRFEFCYAESLTSPTALSDADHLPRHPLVDPLLFRCLKRAGIPSGLYYRDIHWRFDQYKENVSLAKRLVAESFYRFDLAWYSRFIDVLFLPDSGMVEAIPGRSRFRFAALPPGTVRSDQPTLNPDEAESDAGRLDLIYTGSVSPPHNDITPLLRAVAAVPGARLKISCPSSEAATIQTYPPDLVAGVEVLHLTSAEMELLYRDADAACLVYTDHPYRDFAMPVKLFESIGRLTPTITNAQSAAGRFVRQHGIGWIFQTEAELAELLARLVERPEERAKITQNLVDLAPSQSWTARAETVAATLVGIGEAPVA